MMSADVTAAHAARIKAAMMTAGHPSSVEAAAVMAAAHAPRIETAMMVSAMVHASIKTTVMMSAIVMAARLRARVETAVMMMARLVGNGAAGYGHRAAIRQWLMQMTLAAEGFAVFQGGHERGIEILW